MPSPKDARKDSAKKTPDRQEAELGHELARRKSQDFKSKIDGWIEGGAGIPTAPEEGVAIEAKPKAVRRRNVTTPKGDDTKVEDHGEEAPNIGPLNPPDPQLPVSTDKVVTKDNSTRKPTRIIDPDRKAWVRRRSKSHAQLMTNAKGEEPLESAKAKNTPDAKPKGETEISSPKKDLDSSPPVKRTLTPGRRVISDEHWRNDRTPHKDSATPEKVAEQETTPRPKIERRSVANVGLRVPPSVQDFREERERSPARVRPLRRQPRSRSTSREREGREPTPDYESSGVKVYIKRRRREKTLEDQAKDRKAFNTSEDSFTAPSSIGRPSSETDVTTPDATPARSQAIRSSTEPRVRTMRQPANDRAPKGELDEAPLDYEDLGQRVRQRRTRTPNQEDYDWLRLSKRTKSTDNIMQSFKIPATSTPQPAPQMYGSRIEGWLAGMPDDPFGGPPDPSLVPEGLNVPRKTSRRVHSGGNDVGEDNQRISGRRKPSDGRQDDDYDSRPLTADRRPLDERRQHSSGSLERRGAHRGVRSPTHGLERQRTGTLDSNGEIFNQPPRRAPIKRMYEDLPERAVPSTGNRLSTIASVTSLRETRLSYPDESVLSRVSDGDEPARHGTVVRRRSMKHDDLMSVLSLPKDDDQGMNRTRSTRSRRPRSDALCAGDLMNQVTSEELKYQRELRTLVDGVIPVLLQYVLSQKEKLQSPTSRPGLRQGDPTLTKPIIDMGVVLERLKSSHRSIPMHDPSELLRWAQRVSKIYSDYLGVWRLGFNNVVVNLAPAERSLKDDAHAWDDGLTRDEQGDLLHGDGGRVDVAYLLKRPLVRIKSLAKTFAAINQTTPSTLAAETANTYEALVVRAKQRTNDEHARLEDEAAAAIDPSRARDPSTLAPLAGVVIDSARCVRARDFFDLEFFHSSGQQLDCKIEVIFRDGSPGRSANGDILFCEISPAGRWLLFPPLLASNVSARKGDGEGEAIVMVRGHSSASTQWSEIMSLRSDESQSAEWIEILGSDPMPPRLSRRSSFNMLQSGHVGSTSRPSLRESELPIGEQAKPTASRWNYSEINSGSDHVSKSDAYLYGFTATDSVDDIGHANHRDDPRERMKHARSKSEWLPSDATGSQGPKGSLIEESGPGGRPNLRNRTSSVPTMQMPTISKLRRAIGLGPSNKNAAPQSDESTSTLTSEPTSTPGKTQEPSPIDPRTEDGESRNPQSETKTTSQSTRIGSIPSFIPAFLQKPRRSSSPLKHEYEPSTASESSEGELSDGDDNESITSESSAEEAVSTLGELQDFSKHVSMRPPVQARPPDSICSPDGDTLGPSESASQAPYRTVPAAKNLEPAKSVACMFAWSERGSWESIHPGDCQIVVTPGLIEAFDITQANAATSNPGAVHDTSLSSLGVRPLIALELTPWVPLRRGTAVDISIRSPPTPASTLQGGNNIMFRSRSPEECERLYNLINRARIDNPTWIALQNARGPVQTSNWAQVMERRNNDRPQSNSAGWYKAFSRKGSTYRSKGTRSASLAGSQSSVGTANSAFSAIRQLGGGSKIFNIAKSTIMSKQSTRSSYSDSLSSGAATPLPIDPNMGAPLGITNAKIKLYVRESTAKWRDMGNARLTIMLPPRRDAGGPADPRITGLEKRVLVCNKKGNVILDATLRESCFERVARTGIAVSVWEEGIGSNGEVGYAAATGGVSSSKSTVYMVQMKSEREAAYTFSMVGKLRY